MFPMKNGILFNVCVQNESNLFPNVSTAYHVSVLVAVIFTFKFFCFVSISSQRSEELQEDSLNEF